MPEETAEGVGSREDAGGQAAGVGEPQSCQSLEGTHGKWEITQEFQV